MSVSAQRVVEFPLIRNSSAVFLRCFKLTEADHALMLACVFGIRPADCSPERKQRLRDLESKYYVRFSDRAQRWVLSDFGENTLDYLLSLMQFEVNGGPGEVVCISGG